MGTSLADPGYEAPRGFKKAGRAVLLEFDGCGFRATEPTWLPPGGRRHYEVGDLVNLRPLDERHARTQVEEIPPSIQSMGALLRRFFLGGSAPSYLVGHRILAIRPGRRLREFHGLESGVCLDGEIEIAPVIVLHEMVLQSETRHSRVSLKWLSDRSRDDHSYYQFLRAADRGGAAVAQALAGGPVGISRAAVRRAAGRAARRGAVEAAVEAGLEAGEMAE